MLKLLLATTNKGKIKEYRRLLEGLELDIVSPDQLDLDINVEEGEISLEENARIKALAYAEASGLLALADDSGLWVDALGGEPGVRSSRYAGEDADDAERVRYLLSRIEDVKPEERTARFKCAIAIARPDGRVQLCHGECEGTITMEPKGNGGFGYDPIFYVPEYNKTMAELTAEEKNSISHRARTVRQARNVLHDIIRNS